MKSKKYDVIDLFAGIGGFSLGLESLEDFETKLFCEFDEHARRVLSKNFEAPISRDVKKLNVSVGDNKERVFSDGECEQKTRKNLVITGGYPCQDLSFGGSMKGILNGERSRLFFEIARLAQAARPDFVLMENVGRHRKHGLAIVLSTLHEIGYDCEWSIHYARDFGLPHQRERIYILAYPQGQNKEFLNKDIHDKLNPDRDFNKLVYQVPRVSAEGEKWEEDARKQRIKQCGNSIIPAIAKLYGQAMSRGGDDLDLSRYRELFTLSDLEDPEFTELPECGISVNGKVYQREVIRPHRRDTNNSLFPSPVASDCMLILGKNDSYKLTKNGRVRIHRQSGSDASLNLARFVRFYPEGELRACEVPKPVNELLKPEFTEVLMGYPSGWTDVGHKHFKEKRSKKTKKAS